MSDNASTADSPSPSPSASPSFSFPPAAQPSIIRAFQKDAYYQSLFRSSLTDTARSVLGARFLSQHAENVSLLAGVAYWTLASGWGATQTLGEEYVNAIMVQSAQGRIASRRRRLAFVLILALAPHLLSRAYASLRRYAQRQAGFLAQQRERARLRAAALSSSSATQSQQQQRRSRREALYGFLARRLPALESLHASDGWLAYLGAAHLAIFYLGGRYYAVAQRIASSSPSNSASNSSSPPAPAYARGSAGEHAERMMKIDDQLWTHATAPASLVTKRPHPQQQTQQQVVVPLLYPSTESKTVLPGITSSSEPQQIQNNTAQLTQVADSLLRCTLCMEQRTPERGNSAVTECGHVFCWDCITGWAREKPECPLCRQSLAPSRLLPVYNF
ncbi:unnamed protein product [Tilletia caries]|nr:unnamed protein product [Tilletia caries]